MSISVPITVTLALWLFHGLHHDRAVIPCAPESLTDIIHLVSLVEVTRSVLLALGSGIVRDRSVRPTLSTFELIIDFPVILYTKCRYYSPARLECFHHCRNVQLVSTPCF